MAEQQIKDMITAYEEAKNDVFTKYNEPKYRTLIAKYQKDDDCDRRGTRTPSVPTWSEVVAQHHLGCGQEAGRLDPLPQASRSARRATWSRRRE